MIAMTDIDTTLTCMNSQVQKSNCSNKIDIPKTYQTTKKGVIIGIYYTSSLTGTSNPHDDPPFYLVQKPCPR